MVEPTTPTVVLGSRSLAGLDRVVARATGRVVLVPTAANTLPDRDAVVDDTRHQLVDAGWEVRTADPEEFGAEALARRLTRVDAVVVGGGDPYHLLGVLRRTGADEVLLDAVRRGVAYVGVSAGAVVAGPSLAPLAGVSPFPTPTLLALDGMGLTPIVVLAHDDHPQRRARHAAAIRAHAGRLRVMALTDDELLVAPPPTTDGPWRILHTLSGRILRPAEDADARGIATCYVRAARAAWAPIFGAHRLAELQPTPDAWAARIVERTTPDEILVATDPDGVAGFVWVRAAVDPDLAAGHGEVAAFYTDPRLWGTGDGRRLLALGLDHLRGRGCADAVLWTEERNARPRRVYERAGWRLDGTTRAREYLGVPIHELRYRLAL